VTIAVWRIATDTPDYEADDLSGAGAEATGGRWNRAGRPVLYASTTIALACLETLVHTNISQLPLNRFLVRLEVPYDVWAARQEETRATLPVGWSAVPEGKVSLDRGDAWLVGGKSALLLVPSVVVPEEANVLLNPKHGDAKRVTAAKIRGWFYDGRIAIASGRKRSRR